MTARHEKEGGARKVDFDRNAVLRQEATLKHQDETFTSFTDYAPDPTYESAQRLGRLSTIEVMSLVKSRMQQQAQAQQQQSRGGLGSFGGGGGGGVDVDGPNIGFGGNNLSAVRLKLPPDDMSRRARLKGQWRSICEWLRQYGAGWYKRNVPKTLDQNRLGIQWVCCLLLTCSILWSEQAYHFFGLQESFIMISAVSVLDTSYGAHIMKATDRILGIAGAVATAQLLLIPLYYGGVKHLDWGIKIILFFYGSAVAWFWCYIRALKPTHVTLPVVGIATTAGIFAMIKDNYVHSTWIVGLCNAIGIVTGAIVFGCVFPKSARSTLLKDLKTICDKIAHTLEPLVEFEAGVVRSPSFFQRSMASKTGEGGLLRTLSKQFSRSRSSGGGLGAGGGGAAAGGQAEPLPYAAAARLNKGVEVLEPDIFEGFRVAVWKQIESIYTLLDAQNTLLAPASHELSRKPPHRFPTQEYENFYAALKRLFYHVVSLYLVLDTQSSVIRDESMMELLGDRVMYAGVGIKIDPYKEVSTTDDAGKSLPLRHRWSIPGGGLARTLERPATEFEISRQRGKSIPNFAAMEPDMAEEEASSIQIPSQSKSSISTPVTAQPSPPQSISPPRHQRSVSNLSTYVPNDRQSMKTQYQSNNMASQNPAQTGAHGTSHVMTGGDDDTVWNPSFTSDEGPLADIKRNSTTTLAVPSRHSHRSATTTVNTHTGGSPHFPSPPSRSNTPNFRSPSESYLSIPSPVRKSPDVGDASQDPQHLDSTTPLITTPRLDTGAPMHPPLLDPSARQLSLVSVLSEISHQSARTGTAIDDIINATPVVRWVEMYGPLIGRVSKHVALALLQFSTCLERYEMAGPLDDHILLAEEALSELTTRRVLWFRTVQIIFNAQLLKQEGDSQDTPEDVRACIDECLFRRWMGLTPAAYCALTLQARTNFWEAFGNIQDRLSTTARILMGLLVELKTCRNALATFVAASTKSTDAVPA